MNDIEDLVREELRARVDAAEAAAADEQPGTLLADLERRIGRARMRRRWTASAAGAVAVAGAVVLALTLPSHGLLRTNPLIAGAPSSVPLTDTAATPRGWATVAYGDAQISVPAGWQVAARPVCGRVGHGGYVIIGRQSTNLVARNPRCKQAPNMAAIQLLPRGQVQSDGHSARINGILVLRAQPPGRGFVSYLAPALHVLVTARGPLASRVLGTLTRSPLSVVLARGPQFPVPHSWRWHDFGGIKFATPAGWPTEKSNVWYPCWPTIDSPQTVKMVNATRAESFSCNDNAATSPRHGVVVGAGRYVFPHQRADRGCRSLNGLRACFSMPGPGGPLELAIAVPGRQKRTVVDIGLKGNGVEARTIFESIRPR